MNRNLKSFNQFSPVNENVAPAKAWLLKTAADEKRRRFKLDPTEKIEFTPEEEKKILNNPNYVEVRDYFLNTVKKPGLVYPFTYFRIAEVTPSRYPSSVADTADNAVAAFARSLALLISYPLILA